MVVMAAFVLVVIIIIKCSSSGGGGCGGGGCCGDNGGGVVNNRQVTDFAAEEYEFVPRKVRESLPSPPLYRLRSTGRAFSEAERPGLETSYLCLMPI